MKKKQLLATMMLGATVLASSFCVTGCKTNTQKQVTDSLATDSTDTADTADTLAVDSTGFQESKDSTIVCTFAIDRPLGNDSLALAVKKFIAGELANVYLPRNNADGDAMLRRYPLYSGNAADLDKVLRFYGKGTMRYLLEQRKEMQTYFDSDTEMPPLTQKVSISKKDETPAYVTYCVTDEAYLGGAHGSYTFYYVNIDKHTFKPVYNMVDSTRVKALQPMLRKGVLWCLRESGVENVSDANMNDYIILPDNGIIPLPAHTPWVKNDSLNFVYQQYEIASYAVGPIGFNIAVKDIAPYLTKEAKAMLGK